MKIILSALLTAGLCLSASADGFVALHGGPVWPQAVQNLDDSYNRTSANFAFSWGGMVRDLVGIGGVLDFVVKNNIEETDTTTYIDDNVGNYDVYRVDSEIRRRMISLGPAMWIDPMYQSKIRPVFYGMVGLSALIYLTDFDDILEDDPAVLPSGVYWGAIAKVGGDLLLEITDRFSLTAGGEFRWCSVKKRDWGSEYYYRQRMTGPAIRLGFIFR